MSALNLLGLLLIASPFIALIIIVGFVMDELKVVLISLGISFLVVGVVVLGAYLITL